MEKIKFSKGELKRQRDCLYQYERYLPTLQLKKQQLQLEILVQHVLLEEKKKAGLVKLRAVEAWSGLLGEGIAIKQWIQPKELITSVRNIAGVDVAVFGRLDFAQAEYDLFLMPLWLDAAIEHLRQLVSLRCEVKLIEEGIEILRRELRVTTQRVNLFEKVKIPHSQEAIRRIKIYLGDQMANSVGRSKIAKRKIESYLLEEIAV